LEDVVHVFFGGAAHYLILLLTAKDVDQCSVSIQNHFFDIIYTNSPRV